MAELAHFDPFQPAPFQDRALARRERLIELGRRLSQTLALAQGLIHGGRTLDLTGVDDGVGVLCAQTLDLPPEDARVVLPTLHEVLGRLDRLTLALHANTQMIGPSC